MSPDALDTIPTFGNATQTACDRSAAVNTQHTTAPTIDGGKPLIDQPWAAPKGMSANRISLESFFPWIVEELWPLDRPELERARAA